MESSSPEAPLPRVGWREWIRISGERHRPIKAKVDTGARSSALHALDLEPVTRDGAPFLRFTVLPRQRSEDGAFRMEAPLVDRRSVRSSSGAAERRPVVRIQLDLGGLQFPVEVTLTRRDRMGFRMLLGRTALRGRFLVDPSRSFIQGRATRPDANIPPL